MIDMNLIIALSPEAQPIIQYYKLKRVHNITAFEVYKKDNMQLIISGIGKYNAAEATAYLAGLNRDVPNQVWLNVGIAGGEAATLGSTVLANAIKDEESGRIYYPTLCFDLSLPQVSLITVNQPEEAYKSDFLYDMEAAGFFKAASRFSPSELVHSLKIVSDNQSQGIEHISKESASKLVESGLTYIDNVVQVLLELREQLVPNKTIEQAVTFLTGKYNFTTTQLNSLRVVLQNWVAINIDEDIFSMQLENIKNAKELMKMLEDKIKRVPVGY